MRSERSLSIGGTIVLQTCCNNRLLRSAHSSCDLAIDNSAASAPLSRCKKYILYVFWVITVCPPKAALTSSLSIVHFVRNQRVSYVSIASSGTSSRASWQGTRSSCTGSTKRTERPHCAGRSVSAAWRSSSSLLRALVRSTCHRWSALASPMAASSKPSSASTSTTPALDVPDLARHNHARPLGGRQVSAREAPRRRLSGRCARLGCRPAVLRLSGFSTSLKPMSAAWARRRWAWQPETDTWRCCSSCTITPRGAVARQR